MRREERKREEEKRKGRERREEEVNEGRLRARTMEIACGVVSENKVSLLLGGWQEKVVARRNE